MVGRKRGEGGERDRHRDRIESGKCGIKRRVGKKQRGPQEGGRKIERREKTTVPGGRLTWISRHNGNINDGSTADGIARIITTLRHARARGASSAKKKRRSSRTRNARFSFVLRIKWHTFHARILPYIRTHIHTHTHTPTHTHSRGRVQSNQYLVRIGSNGGASRNADILDYKIKHVRRNTARLVCERKKKRISSQR